MGTVPRLCGPGSRDRGDAATIVLLITIRTAAAPLPALALLSKGLNELLFPFGCSMVLYVLNAMGQRIRLTVAA